MTHAGDPRASLEPATVERLWARAEAIVAAASVPGRDREGVVEELFGHLIERTAALVASGRPEADAAHQAIAGFGDVGRLATDLSTAFHSRLWASTIGVLLPAVLAPEDRPGVIGWLRFALGIGMVLTVIGLAGAVWQGSAGWALVSIGILGLGLFGLLMAFHALNRGQRWALWYAIAFAVELVVLGVVSVVAPEVPGSITIPVGAILGLCLLLGVHAARDRLRDFVAGSPPLGRGLTALLIASFLGPLLLVPARAAIPDPTQATADALHLVVSVRCDHGPIEDPAFQDRGETQRVTVVMDMTWRRSDLLPMGLGGLLDPNLGGDTAGLRVSPELGAEAQWEEWMVIPQDPAVVDIGSSDVAGWHGGTSPSIEFVPEPTYLYAVGVMLDAMRAGHTLRTTWLLVPRAAGETPWPTVEVAYAHLDRFLLVASAGCGEDAVGVEMPMVPRGSDQLLDPLDGMLP